MPPATANVTGTSCVPVAVTSTCVTDPVAIVTVSVFAPTDVPSVHEPTLAVPFTPVTAVTEPTAPFTDAEKNTVTPDTGLPYRSVTVTLGAVDTAVPTVAD